MFFREMDVHLFNVLIQATFYSRVHVCLADDNDDDDDERTFTPRCMTS
jgi:hypothetical protein